MPKKEMEEVKIAQIDAEEAREDALEFIRDEREALYAIEESFEKEGAGSF